MASPSAVNLHTRPGGNDLHGPGEHVAMAAPSLPCPHACPGKACQVEPVGDGELPQSGDSYLPATRYARPDCPAQAVTVRATGARWRARA